MGSDVCEKCGKPLSGNERYCTQCGTPTKFVNLSADRGLRFGAICGFIDALMKTICAYPTMNANIAMAKMELANYRGPARLVALSLAFEKLFLQISTIIFPIFAIGVGAILGIIFVKVQYRIPSRTITQKAMVFAFAVNSISVVSYFSFFLQERAVFVTFWGILIGNYIAALVIDLVVAGLLFSYLLENR